MAWFARSKQEPVVDEEVVEEPRLPEPPALNEAGLRSVADHTAYLLSLVDPLRPFGMTLLEGWNQVVCEDIDSMISVPAFSTAKVDGYAVRSSDLTEDDGRLVEALDVVDAVDDRLPIGAALPVQPGDVLPAGANAVLPGTFATVEDGRATLIEKVEAGEYVRAAGEHLALGTRLLSQGDILTERAIGLLAGAGIDKAMVRPRPRVVVISSGDNLVEPGVELAPGESADANSYMIAAAARAVGATVFRVAVHTNDRETIKQVITDQLIRADLVISATGGSREDYEAMVAVMKEIGLVDEANVAMSPGSTQTFGLVGDEQVPMLMLPGNPVSAYVTFHVFAKPLLRQLMGADTGPRPGRAIATGTLRSNEGQLHLLRGQTVSDQKVTHVTQVTSPYALGQLAKSNVLIVMDEHVELVRPGEAVKVWFLDGE